MQTNRTLAIPITAIITIATTMATITVIITFTFFKKILAVTITMLT